MLTRVNAYVYTQKNVHVYVIIFAELWKRYWQMYNVNALQNILL